MAAEASSRDALATKVVALRTAKVAARGGFLWGLVFGGTIAATMSTFHTSFPTAASRADLVRTIEGNAAFEAMFGLVRRMDTVAGYTAYKTTMTLVVLAAIWGLLIATRVLRGDEDTGRWELMLAGQTTRGGATLQAVTGLGVGLVSMWLATAALAVAVGRAASVGIAAGASVFFAFAVVATAAMFMGVGVLASQLTATRHDADLLGAGVIAASYLVRMAADSDPRIGWLRWTSPIGWIEETRPLTGSRAIAFLPAAAFTALAVTVAIVVARHRDVGAAAFARREAPHARTYLLGGQGTLTLRLTLPTIAAWLLAFAATGLTFGLVTQAAGRSLQGSPTLERVIARVGATSRGATTYLGFVFLVAAGLVAVAVAGQVAATRNEEAAGRLDNLLVRPVARTRWLASRLAVGISLLLLASVLTAVAAWVGATTQHASVGLVPLLEAGLNVAPPAVFVLGAGVLVYGVLPRAAIGATYGLVVWSFLVETLALITKSSHWVRDTSPLLHITPAPAADPNWTAAAWLVALGLAAAAGGIAAFARRDLVGA